MNHIFSGNQKNINHKISLLQPTSHKHGKQNKEIPEVGGQIVDEAEIKEETLLGVSSASNMDI